MKRHTRSHAGAASQSPWPQQAWLSWPWRSARAAAPRSPPAASAERVSGGPTGHYVVAAGIHKIKHIIVIEQENRSFDSYFGTYPGADGIPMKNGVPTVCVPTPTGGCQAPYHDTADVNGGGPHGERERAHRRRRREDGRVHHRRPKARRAAEPT